MSFTVSIDGTPLPASRLLLPVDGGLTERADGTAGRAGVFIDDPDESLDLTSWRTFVVEEDDCTPPRIFTGWVISRAISRGPYKGEGRLWDCDLIDLNEQLELRRLRVALAIRPRESGSDRLDWLFGAIGMNGVVYDNGKVMANAWIYDEADYRDKTAADVLRDIVSADTDDRWTFFLYWDDSAAPGEEISLFYGRTTTTLYDSTLSISNVIGDSSSTCIYPSIDASLLRDPEGQYGGVYLSGVFGRLYETSPTTIAAMGLIRDGYYTSDRLINLETAQRHASRYLAWHANEVDTITCTLILDPEQVNLILPGQRISVRFTHLPGYETFTYTRVQSRTVTLAQDRKYRVYLELSEKGILQSGGAGGGGGPGEFPHQTTCAAPTKVQDASAVSGFGTLTVTLGAAPTSGNTLVAYQITHENTAAYSLLSAQGWSEHPNSPLIVPNPGGATNAKGHCRLWYKTSDGSETATAISVSAETRLVIAEFSGERVLSDSDSHTSSTFISPDNLPCQTGSVSVVANDLVVAVGIWSDSLEATTTYSVDEGAIVNSGGGMIAQGPPWATMWKAATGTGTSDPIFTEHAGMSAIAANGTAGLVMVLSCANSAASNPPSPGQPFGPVIPVETPDGSITTFTLPAGYEFADGSLRVYVDRLDQSAAITSYDGAARTFTLAFAPLTGWLVEAYGQGR